MKTLLEYVKVLKVQAISVFPSLVVALFSPQNVSQAQPFEWSLSNGGNGHFYEVVNAGEDIHWTEARDAAEAAGGYLATITSEPENDFVFNLTIANIDEFWNFLANGHGPWIGGFQNMDSVTYAEPAGGWEWITGEEFLYTNWRQSPGLEPNEFFPGENFIQYLGNGIEPAPTWNDSQNSPISAARVSAYVIEYDSDPNDSDGDGVPDSDDDCPASDLGVTVVIGGEDTGVSNDLLNDGCTLSDLVTNALAASSNNSDFVHFLLDLKHEGLISGKEMGAILKEVNDP